ncbi:hypothetical protein SAMN05443287_106212 [Micromonospora phaseoli]|uniref:DUF4435 domain-containing protein n=1 Tax=Micromonospora phaseoli TaxID=1144548 RepID=A0A1H7ALC5_9ACTN|nr:hypothetical protein CLV64_107177 [Micromonospora phaseoli]GIJ75977.1 hypothetical protein Xph01_04090 [Micromonospora phaseoli]SEJ66443.1 hypothetical protein SAMN05443287_106212 [Micromonospora phaseoli]
MITSIKAYDRVADRIRQHRQADSRPVIVVEGPADSRFLRAGFDDEYVIFPTGTRSSAINVTEQLSAWRIPDAACVVDRDFDDEVRSRELSGFPVFAYENADLEAMASKTDAFDLMIYELGSEQKVRDNGGPEAISRLIHMVVEPIARLRAANAAKRWGLAFDKVNVADKVSLKTLEFNLDSYCAALRGESISPPSMAELISVANGSVPLPYVPLCPRRSSPYYRGRDFLAVAGVALRRRAGSCQKAATDAEHLGGVIRAIACKNVKNSPWGKDLRTFFTDLRSSSGARIPRPR